VTLFQNVWVLSVGNDIGQATVRSFAPGEDGAADGDGLQGNPTITLALTASEAQKLIMAQSVGDLSLSLRSLWETEKEVKLSPATVPSTLGITERVRSRRRKMFDIQ
jgi:Flp pilus assembly protein CpaB